MGGRNSAFFFGLNCVVLPIMKKFINARQRNVCAPNLFCAFISVCLFLFSARVFSQINLNFAWYFNHSRIQLADLPFKTMNSDSLAFESLKCYVSKIVFLQDDKVVYAENNSFHLLDAANVESLKINLACKSPFNKIRFTLGVDSITNVSGAMGGDLDPSKGMYWAWQSGYINVKMEGKSLACKNPQKAFQFHLGGYAYPYSNAKVITLASTHKPEQNIMIQLAEWYKYFELQKFDHIMSPSSQAQKMTLAFSNCFQISAP